MEENLTIEGLTSVFSSLDFLNPLLLAAMQGIAVGGWVFGYPGKMGILFPVASLWDRLQSLF